MFQYFLRRLLLTIPTFFGCTLVVFTIVQLAPGGPIEQKMMQLRAAGQESGAASATAGQTIPQSAIDELKRQYHFDRPWYERYLIWLGLYPGEVESFKFKVDEARLIGDGRTVKVQKTAAGYQVVDAANPSIVLDGWEFEDAKSDAGEPLVRIVRKEVSGIFTLDFGTSYKFKKPVIELVADRLPVSMQFGLIAFILSYSVCLYLGILKAINHNSTFDFVSSTLIFIAYSVPGWAFGAVLLVFFASDSGLPIFPLGGFQSEDYLDLEVWEKIGDRAWHFVLPTIAYTMAGFASLTMLMKNSLLETLGQDYIRTAFAKGIRETRVIWLHAMRNSIIPIAAHIGGIIGIFLGGSYLIELAFNIEGIGKLSFEAILSRDYPIIFAFTVINVIITLVASILSDLAIALVDPRIRFK